MKKVKDIVKTKGGRKTRIRVKDLIGKVREKLNAKRVEKACDMLEEKYKQLEEAEAIVRKINKQIDEIKEMDIAEIELDEHEY